MHDDHTVSEQYVRQILEIPYSLSVLSIIGIGYPAENPEPIPEEKLKADKVHINRW